MDGRWRDPAANLLEDRWINARLRLGLVTGTEAARVRGYAPGHAMARLKRGMAGVFISDDHQMAKIPIRITRVAAADVPDLDLLELADRHGGPIAVADSQERLTPTKTWYPVTAALEAPIDLNRTHRGVILAKGVAESLAARAWRRVVYVLVRESGL